jgi:hypothetical protein
VRYLTWFVIAALAVGCARQPRAPVSEQYRTDARECEYEAKKASPAAVSSVAGMGAAIGAAAARESELFGMCMRARGWNR